MYKILKVNLKTATIIGVGSSICGGSAVVATWDTLHNTNGEVLECCKDLPVGLP